MQSQLLDKEEPDVQDAGYIFFKTMFTRCLELANLIPSKKVARLLPRSCTSVTVWGLLWGFTRHLCWSLYHVCFTNAFNFLSCKYLDLSDLNLVRQSLQSSSLGCFEF